MDASDPVIGCTNLTKQFGAVTALDRLSFTVPAGAVVGYLGPNGAGKSTTMRILMDLARPTSGSVAVLGTSPRAGGPDVRRRIGYLPGELRLDERLSVRQTLELWARLRRDSVDPAYVEGLCERIALNTDRDTKGLSSGNRRKVGLVGAFMAKPALLILDEPTNGLDPIVQEEFLSMVDEVRADGRTVFLSSHVLGEVERVADHVIVIREGRAVFAGTMDELRRTARQPFTVWFAEDPPIEELRASPGLSVTDTHGRQVSGVLDGSPAPLIAVLARHPVDRLQIPEPELEEAFLRLYEGSGTASGNVAPGEPAGEGVTRR